MTLHNAHYHLREDGGPICQLVSWHHTRSRQQGNNNIACLTAANKDFQESQH